MKCSNDMEDIFKILMKILIIFDDMIADTFSKKKLQPVATELTIKGRKQKIIFLLSLSLILRFQKI